MFYIILLNISEIAKFLEKNESRIDLVRAKHMFNQYRELTPDVAYWPLIDYGLTESTDDIAPRFLVRSLKQEGCFEEVSVGVKEINIEAPSRISELHYEGPHEGLLGGMPPRKNNRKFNTRVKGKRIVRRPNNGIPANLRGNDIMPPHKKVILNYLDPIVALATPGQSFLVKSLRVNGPFDPDPTVLSSGISGFVQLMLFYNFYRVDKINVQWNPSNNEAFALMVGMIFSQVELNPLILTRQEAIDALENGITTKAFTLQNRQGGQSVHNFNRTLALKNLLGNPALYDGDVAYTGTANSNPADLLFVNFIVIAPTNTTFLVNGVVGSIELRFFTHLFGRTTLDDNLLLNRLEKKLDSFSEKQLRDAMVRVSIQNEKNKEEEEKSLIKT